MNNLHHLEVPHFPVAATDSERNKVSAPFRQREKDRAYSLGVAHLNFSRVETSFCRKSKVPVSLVSRYRQRLLLQISML